MFENTSAESPSAAKVSSLQVRWSQVRRSPLPRKNQRNCRKLLRTPTGCAYHWGIRILNNKRNMENIKNPMFLGQAFFCFSLMTLKLQYSTLVSNWPDSFLQIVLAVVSGGHGSGLVGPGGVFSPLLLPILKPPPGSPKPPPGSPKLSPGQWEMSRDS